MERERMERELIERERMERERERELRERELREREMRERELRERELREREREREILERERLERIELERERERQIWERERTERERIERERLDRERFDLERRERERERELIERDRLERERMERGRLDPRDRERFDREPVERFDRQERSRVELSRGDSRERFDYPRDPYPPGPPSRYPSDRERFADTREREIERERDRLKMRNEFKSMPVRDYPRDYDPNVNPQVYRDVANEKPLPPQTLRNPVGYPPEDFNPNPIRNFPAVQRTNSDLAARGPNSRIGGPPIPPDDFVDPRHGQSLPALDAKPTAPYLRSNSQSTRLDLPENSMNEERNLRPPPLFPEDDRGPGLYPRGPPPSSYDRERERELEREKIEARLKMRAAYSTVSGSPGRNRPTSTILGDPNIWNDPRNGPFHRNDPRYVPPGPVGPPGSMNRKGGPPPLARAATTDDAFHFRDADMMGPSSSSFGPPQPPATLDANALARMMGGRPPQPKPKMPFDSNDDEAIARALQEEEDVLARQARAKQPPPQQSKGPPGGGLRYTQVPGPGPGPVPVGAGPGYPVQGVYPPNNYGPRPPINRAASVQSINPGRARTSSAVSSNSSGRSIDRAGPPPNSNAIQQQIQTMQTMGLPPDLQRRLLRGDGDLDEAAFRRLEQFTEAMTPVVYKGVNPDFLKNLPVRQFNRTCPSSQCLVCLEEFEEGERMNVIPSCQHYFHPGCIKQWLTEHKNCPVCRHDAEK
eukprot:TRINITY_DN2972_c0_g2_i2.p1 TRINITY_DN2972_c0_g2~~TRINITY_DN2972_c0_g2_i2.p1  ORF type:complete len:805 (+),score=194.01 TRINITY_DN2972_c0_g2_i2:230-2416(+)